MSDPVGGTLTHVILSHTVTHLPNFLLRKVYKQEKLRPGLHFSFPNGSVEIFLAGHELRAEVSILNALPFDMILRYLQIEIQPDRKFRLVTLSSAREHILPFGKLSVVKLHHVGLSDFQVQRVKDAPGNVWLFGEADLEAPFGNRFTLNIAELNCTPNVY
jgi:hypothetical protein